MPDDTEIGVFEAFFRAHGVDYSGFPYCEVDEYGATQCVHLGTDAILFDAAGRFLGVKVDNTYGPSWMPRIEEESDDAT